MRVVGVIVVCLIVAQAITAQEQKADFATPQKTYETYLRAILAKDLKGAIASHHLVGERADEVLDVAVGMWVVAHELHETARLKFGEKGLAVLQEWNDNLFRTDCAKEAVERTLKRVRAGKEMFEGDTASLAVTWGQGEPLEKDVFHYSGEHPLEKFRKVGGQWKIDLHVQTGLKRPADFFSRGTWGTMLREVVAIERAVLDDLRSGKLRTADETIAAFETRIAELYEKYDPNWRKHDALAKAAARVKCPLATHLRVAPAGVSSDHVPTVAVSESGVVYAIWRSYGDDKPPAGMPVLPNSLEFGKRIGDKLSSCAPGIHVLVDGKWSEPGRLVYGPHQVSPVFAWCAGEDLHLLVCDAIKNQTHHVVFDPKKKTWTVQARLPHYMRSFHNAFRVVGNNVHVAFEEEGDFWYLTFDGERWSKPLRLDAEGRIVSGGRLIHLAVTDQQVAHVAWWAMVEKGRGNKDVARVNRRAVVRAGKIEHQPLRFDDAPIKDAEFDIGIDRAGQLLIAYQADLPEKHADANKIHVRRLVDDRWTDAAKIDGEGERLFGNVVVVGNKTRTLITWSQRETYSLPGGRVLTMSFQRLSVDGGKGWSPPRWVARHPTLRGDGVPVSIRGTSVYLDKAGLVHMVWGCCSYCMVEDLNRRRASTMIFPR